MSFPVANEPSAPIDALAAGVIGVAQVYDEVAAEIAREFVIELGREAPPAPLHLVIEHL
jgi:hypothetical protein